MTSEKIVNFTPGDDFLLAIKNVSLLAMQFYCARHEIFQLCQCQYTVIQIDFAKKYLTYTLPGLFSRLIKILNV